MKTSHRTMSINCNNATWDLLVHVSDEYNMNFLVGGPFGFSCDISSFPGSFKEKLKKFISEYKQMRSFYANATLRILCETDNITVFMYENDNRAQIICFTKQVYQDYIIVYPPCDEKASYIVNGIVTDGKALSENGILIDDLKPFDCKSITAVRRT